MTPFSRRSLLLSSAGLAVAAAFGGERGYGRPRVPARIDVDALVPTRFGRWQVDPDIRPILPDEQQQVAIDDAYDAWFGRVYRRDDGRIAMLVVAYGNGNSRALAMHRPEGCYSARGFAVRPAGERPLPAPYAGIVGRRLVASDRERTEPVIFWMTIANRQTGFGIEQNIRLLRAAWAGKPADGLLVRASTIGPDGFALVQSFLVDMLSSLTPAAAARFGAG